jgi:hypothetical protein
VANGWGGAQFGYSIALSANARFAAIGAPGLGYGNPGGGFVFNLTTGGTGPSSAPLSEERSSNSKPQNVEPSTKLIVFPNSAQTFVNLQVGLNTQTLTSLSIVNVSGSTVFEKKFYPLVEQWSETIDISRFSDGVYTIVLSQGDLIHRQRFVKQR